MAAMRPTRPTTMLPQPPEVAAYARSRQAAAFSGENNLLKRFPTKVAGSNSLCAAQTQSHNPDAGKPGNRNTIAHRPPGGGTLPNSSKYIDLS